MRFIELLQSVFRDTIGSGQSLVAFRPEFAICATIVALLITQMLFPRLRHAAFYVTLLGVCVAFCFVLTGAHGEIGVRSKEIFSGMLVFDSFSTYMRGLLFFFAALFALFTQISGTPRSDDAAEFFTLMLGALLGMCLMVSSNHLLVILLGMEMASVPSYVLAGWRRERRESSEAALKYAVYGAGASGIMLFGMSLLLGALGSAHLPTMSVHLADVVREGLGSERTMVLMLGALMITVGVGYKLSAFPFHFWAPDVFEGATAEVAAFLSIASKAAALALLLRLGLAFSYSPDPSELEALAPTRQYVVFIVSLMAALTCTFGNLAAYGQNNIKRMLAYSTIAHAGYMMMAVAAALSATASDPKIVCSAVSSLAVYISIYLFMNLAAFAGAAFLRNAGGGEDIRGFSGLVRRSPTFVVCMSIVMFSLLGIPPLSGFVAKFCVFERLCEAKLYPLLIVGAINTAVSLFYYLRVVKIMTLGEEPVESLAPCVPAKSISGAYFVLLTAPVVVLFFAWDGLARWADFAASSVLR